jgi:hypothetical protein
MIRYKGKDLTESKSFKEVYSEFSELCEKMKAAMEKAPMEGSLNPADYKIPELEPKLPYKGLSEQAEKEEQNEDKNF